MAWLVAPVALIAHAVAIVKIYPSREGAYLIDLERTRLIGAIHRYAQTSHTTLKDLANQILELVHSDYVRNVPYDKLLELQDQLASASRAEMTRNQAEAEGRGRGSREYASGLASKVRRTLEDLRDNGHEAPSGNGNSEPPDTATPR